MGSSGWIFNFYLFSFLISFIQLFKFYENVFLKYFYLDLEDFLKVYAFLGDFSYLSIFKTFKDYFRFEDLLTLVIKIGTF